MILDRIFALSQVKLRISQAGAFLGTSPRRESAFQPFVLFWKNPEGIYDISEIEEMGASQPSVMLSHLWTDSETISEGKH